MTRCALVVLTQHLAICRLSRDEPVPAWVLQQPFWSVTRTEEELSVVLPEEAAAIEWQTVAGWRCLQVCGPLDLSLTGVLASIATPLAEADIPIFAISTHHTDYVLVPGAYLERAIRALRAAGHEVRDQLITC